MCLRLYCVLVLICEPVYAYVCTVCLYELVLVCEPVCAYVCIVCLYHLVLVCEPVCACMFVCAAVLFFSCSVRVALSTTDKQLSAHTCPVTTNSCRLVTLTSYTAISLCMPSDYKHFKVSNTDAPYTTISLCMPSDYKHLQVSNTDVSYTAISLCMPSDYKHLQVSKIEMPYTAFIPVTINARIHRLSSLICHFNS